MLPTESELLSKIDAFMARTGIAPSEFGEMACNDRSFVLDLRCGERELRRSTVEKVEKWIAGFEAGVRFSEDRSSRAA